MYVSGHSSYKLKLGIGIWWIFTCDEMAGAHLVAGLVRAYLGRTRIEWRIYPNVTIAA